MGMGPRSHVEGAGCEGVCGMSTQLELLALSDELREFTAMRYMGDCKCGKCQLVPRTVLDRAITTIRTVAQRLPNPELCAVNPVASSSTDRAEQLHTSSGRNETEKSGHQSTQSTCVPDREAIARADRLADEIMSQDLLWMTSGFFLSDDDSFLIAEALRALAPAHPAPDREAIARVIDPELFRAVQAHEITLSADAKDTNVRRNDDYQWHIRYQNVLRKADAILALAPADPAPGEPFQLYELPEEEYAKFVEALGGNKAPTQALIGLMRDYRKATAPAPHAGEAVSEKANTLRLKYNKACERSDQTRDMKDWVAGYNLGYAGALGDALDILEIAALAPTPDERV